MTYKTEKNFIASFAPDLTERYCQSYGKAKMILSDKVPTLSIARCAFGNEAVRIVIKQHLLKLAISFGVESTEEQINEISSVFFDMAIDMKLTEIMLFFQLMKQNEFKNKKGENLADMKVRLSIKPISECLSNYRNDYRQRVIEQYEKEQKEREREESYKNCATIEERKQIILKAAKNDPYFMSIAKGKGWI